MRFKIMGCLYGGAIGDAMGFPIEFYSDIELKEYFKGNKIRKFLYQPGLISDDTQMTLFTLEGLLKQINSSSKEEKMDKIIQNIYESYLAWYFTQTHRYSLRNTYEKYSKDNLLLNKEFMFDLRAPGNTCLSALHSGKMGTIETPINESKGCGGVMRVAPIGFVLSPKEFSDEEVVIMGARTAAITHGHELGYIPAGMFALLIRKLIHNKLDMLTAIQESLRTTEKVFKGAKHIDEFIKLMEKSMSLAVNNDEDIKNIHKLGEGWVGDEAFAIGVYAALRYQTDIKDGIVAAINHGGDSDSTGSIAGNILGAHLDAWKLPKSEFESLEGKDLICEYVDKTMRFLRGQ